MNASALLGVCACVSEISSEKWATGVYVHVHELNLKKKIIEVIAKMKYDLENVKKVKVYCC